MIIRKQVKNVSNQRRVILFVVDLQVFIVTCCWCYVISLNSQKKLYYIITYAFAKFIDLRVICLNQLMAKSRSIFVRFQQDVYIRLFELSDVAIGLQNSLIVLN